MTITAEHYQETANLFQPVFKRFDNTERLQNEKPLLAHYTSIQVLEQMMKEQEVWFSNPLFMNDLEEVRFGINEGVRLFLSHEDISAAAGSKSRLDLLHHAFNHYFKMLDDEGAFDIYVFCLSEHRRENYDGLLSMWRGYGGHGNGAAIIFDTARLSLVQGSPLQLAKVYYGSQEQRRDQLLTILKEWCKILEVSQIQDERLYAAAYMAFNAIKIFALTSKHDGFLEENEWQIIYLPEYDTASHLKDSLSYHIPSQGVEPKLKFKVEPVVRKDFPKIELTSLIERIILGPSVSSKLALMSVKRMLTQFNRAALVDHVFASSIPLRPMQHSR